MSLTGHAMSVCLVVAKGLHHITERGHDCRSSECLTDLRYARAQKRFGQVYVGISSTCRRSAYYKHT